MFQRREVCRRDESLYELWSGLVADIKKLQQEIVGTESDMNESTTTTQDPCSSLPVTEESAIEEEEEQNNSFGNISGVLNEFNVNLSLGDMLELDLPIVFADEEPATTYLHPQEAGPSSANKEPIFCAPGPSSEGQNVQPKVLQSDVYMSSVFSPQSIMSMINNDCRSQIVEDITDMDVPPSDEITPPYSTVPPISSNDCVTPEKVLYSNAYVPSPFKKALFWPEVKPNPKKRQPKEKVPSVITSEAWKAFYKKKEDEKKEVLMKKEMRKLKREQLAEIKKEKEIKKKSKETKLKKKTSAIVEESEMSAEEVFPEPVAKPIPVTDTHTIKVSQWVVVPYKVGSASNKFVGQVMSVNLNENIATIKYLSKKSSDKFAWPPVEDIDEAVPMEEIVFQLSEPRFDRWGYLTFNEDLKDII